MIEKLVENIVNIKNVSKNFKVGTQDVFVLKDVSLSIKMYDFIIIIGPSGCGKSTLLHTILGLEVPTSGEVTMLDKNLYTNTTEDERSNFRKNHVGMVYQQPNWIKSLTVIENIAFPLMLLGTKKIEAIPKAQEKLKIVGMESWEHFIPTELSGGQQQKVAIARALVTNPEIIVADEPTGNLDFESGKEVMETLSQLNSNSNKTIVMVTHDLDYLKYAKSAIRMLDGKIVEHLKTNSVSSSGENVTTFGTLKAKRGSSYV